MFLAEIVAEFGFLFKYCLKESDFTDINMPQWGLHEWLIKIKLVLTNFAFQSENVDKNMIDFGMWRSIFFFFFDLWSDF